MFSLAAPTPLDFFAALVGDDDQLPLLEAAVSIAQDEHPDLDIQQVLGDVDQLLARLRRQPEPAAGSVALPRGDTPVIIMTARDAVPARIEGLDAGADDYLIKPIAIEELAGIAEQEQERIFDMYYKSNDGRRLSIMGSGIGLSVSRALVEAMQGCISVSSVVGKGSRFAVALPIGGA